jgi:hypothetical protein
MKKKLLISFSGGRTSAFMLWWLMNEWPLRHLYDIVVVYANTGKEKEETLQFVQDCSDYWGVEIIWVEAVPKQSKKGGWWGVRHRIVDFSTASRKGEPFAAMIDKLGLPCSEAPFCSDQLKRLAIESYLKSIGWKNYHTAIGIRYDETHRIDPKKEKRRRLFYPLARITKTTKSDISFFWTKQPFGLDLKSYEGNCDLCWKKSNRKLITILKEDPSVADWWVDMETRYENFVPDGRDIKSLPLRMFRGGVSIFDLLAASKTNFRPAVDESSEYDAYKQLSFAEMVEQFDLELDIQDGGCSESCEAF